MKILVINAGSSSLKFQFINMENKEVIAKGIVERINEGKSFLRYKAHGTESIFDKDIKNHTEALEIVLEKLTDETIGVIASTDEIDAFGHRVVNVGDQYFDPILVDKDMLDMFRTKTDFAPLHMPGSIAGIDACLEICPKTPNVAVFDIGFHKTIEPKVYRYGLPKRYYDEYRIRRYGAHGTSHYFVTQECAKLLGKDVNDINIVTCHIGSGASITAVKNGKSFDTSMGFTPLEGIMMNTRSGDIDPAIIEFICNKENKTVSEVIKMLNKESGLIGANGKVSDMRDILANMDDEDVKLSYDMYTYRIKKYICGYIGVLGGVDAIVFTAGVGEHTPEMRRDVTEGLEFMGIKIDNELNFGAKRGAVTEISDKDSKVKVFIIPTDEEMVIAEETAKLVK
ncbi:MAG: acetate kinase [Clostridiales bacterium]|nr:acetate kinase [Clostridiales bacterium]